MPRSIFFLMVAVLGLGMVLFKKRLLLEKQEPPMPRSIFFLMVAVLGLGMVLFQVKHQVMSLEQELSQVRRATIDSQKAIHVLRAEWELLVKPERLQSLAQKHLGLVPFEHKQYITPEKLRARLQEKSATDPVIALIEEALRDTNNPQDNNAVEKQTASGTKNAVITQEKQTVLPQKKP